MNDKYVVVGHSWDGQVNVFSIDGGPTVRHALSDSISCDGITTSASNDMRLRGLGLLADDYEIFAFGVKMPKSGIRLRQTTASAAGPTVQQVLTVLEFLHLPTIQDQI